MDCVASGSRSAGGLYKAPGVPRALAFALRSGLRNQLRPRKEDELNEEEVDSSEPEPEPESEPESEPLSDSELEPESDRSPSPSRLLSCHSRSSTSRWINGADRKSVNCVNTMSPLWCEYSNLFARQTLFCTCRGLQQRCSQSDILSDCKRSVDGPPYIDGPYHKQPTYSPTMCGRP